MIFLISLVSAMILTWLFRKSIRRHPLPFYIATAVISIAVVYCTWNHVSFPEWFSTWIWPVFARGALAGALFVVIMWTGALPNGSEAIKQLMPIRAQLSIIACILTFGHNIAYGKTYFTGLFFTPSRLSTTTLLATVCSLIMILIMLPLFFTSFKAVRSKMEARNWKRLQRFAYLFYGLLYCHVMLLTIPNAVEGRIGYTLTVFVYSFVFLSYLFCRILKAIAIRERTAASLPKKQAGGFLIGGIMAGLILLSVLSAKKTAAVQDELETLKVSFKQTYTSDVSFAAVKQTETAIPENKTVPNEDPASETVTPVPVRSPGKYRDGIYTGSAKGNHGKSSFAASPF